MPCVCRCLVMKIALPLKSDSTGAPAPRQPTPSIVLAAKGHWHIGDGLVAQVQAVDPQNQFFAAYIEAVYVV